MSTHDELVVRKMARINEVHRVDPKRTALMVIDMQRSFMDPEASLAVPQAWEILPTIKKLLEFFRQNNLLVIFTAYVASPKIPCLRVDPFGPEHMIPEPGQPTGWGMPSSNSVLGMSGPEDPAIINDLKPLPTELVIEGYTLDKFYGTPLELALFSQDIRYLVFTGMMTDLCLGATLFSAAMRDYRVTAVKDAITTIWPNIQDCMFDIFARKLSRVINSDEVIREIKEQL